MTTIRITTVQLRVTPSKKENLPHVLDYIRQAIVFHAFRK